jgi:CheY-like chemotaxis protein
MQPSYVLIVDDEPSARMLLERIVTNLGILTRHANDGVEALEAIREEVPALILLDIMMPRMDGFEVLATMRADPDMRNIPVVVITAATAFEIPRLPGVAAIFNKANFNIEQVSVMIASMMGVEPPEI